jgi:UDP-glucose 4-epimerase
MVEGLLLALEHPNAVGESFNIGNARSAVTIYDLARRIKQLSGCSGRDRLPTDPLPRRRAADPERRQGPRAARFEANVELDEGLEKRSRGTERRPLTSV